MKRTHPTSIFAILPSCAGHDRYDITVMKFVLLVKKRQCIVKGTVVESFCPNILAVSESPHKVAIRLLSSCYYQIVISISTNCHGAVKTSSGPLISWKIQHTTAPPGRSERPPWPTGLLPWQPDASKSRINLWTYLCHTVLLENLRKACRRWSRYWQSSWRRRKQSQRQLEPWKITLPIFNFACILSKVQEFKNQIGLI